MRILFIGNSHTYFNDMPAMVADLARSHGVDCQVTMLAHGGWFLAQHVEEPEVRFNILHGDYDYVILQEHSQPFGPMEKYREAVRTLNEWIRQAGSTPVIYMTWSLKSQPEKQEELIQAYRQMAEEIGALLVPVGQGWWEYQREHPEVEMYFRDGAHASKEGSRYAAEKIWEVLQEDQSEAFSDLTGLFYKDQEDLKELRELRSVIAEYFEEDD